MYEDDEPTDPNLVIPKVLRGPAASLTSAPASDAGTSNPPPPPRTAGNIGGPGAVNASSQIFLGPIDSLMKDPTITEIMINDLRNVMIERDGKMSYSGFSFQSLDDLNLVVRTLLDATGKFLTPESPYVDTSLPDGSRVHLVGSPITQKGPCITIRKFPKTSFTLKDLVSKRTLDFRMNEFLIGCVQARINLLISGGTGSGKTSLLNALIHPIPHPAPNVTFEDTPELVMSHRNSVSMQTKPQTPSSPEVNARQLVVNSLRMRPDRIIVGECRKGEALDMLQAMNTGHSGSITTVHANFPRDALSRIETLCLMSEVNLPLMAIRKQMVSALDLIVHVRRYRDGVRRISSIMELTGLEGEVPTLQEIFLYDETAGAFRCTGFVPTFFEEFESRGVSLRKDFFA
ncbi:MAG: CpaF family protein [Methylotenera sp.]|nr:CpaF family protein [Oligoflexia bacterium]